MTDEERKAKGPTPTAKVCACCKAELPLSAFAKAALGALGVTTTCKACRSHLRKPTLRSERAEAARLFAARLNTCNVCAQIKPWCEFPTRRASRADGLSTTCRACAVARSAKWNKEHPRAFAEWYQNNIDHARQKTALWREANREYCRAEYRRWAKDNPDRINALVARRNATKLRATPAWANHDAIRAVYAEAARLTLATGVRHEVDHIVPLRSAAVCGLHWEANLQILTSAANKKKSNHIEQHNPATCALRASAAPKLAATSGETSVSGASGGGNVAGSASG